MPYNAYGYNVGYQPYNYGQPMPAQMPQMGQNQMPPANMQGGNQTQNVQPMNSTIQPQAPAMPSTPFGSTVNSSGILWCRSRDEALAWPVAPNNAVALWDMNAPFVYLKQADATGKPTLIPYELVDRSQDANAQATRPQNAPQTANVAPQVQLDNYVTKDDITALQARIDELERMIQEQEIVYSELPAETKSEPRNESKAAVRTKKITVSKGE